MESDLSMTCDPGLGVSTDVSSDDCKHTQAPDAQSDFNQITERRERLWEGFITKDSLDDGEQETVDTELGTDCNEHLSTTLQVGFIQNSYNQGSFTDNVTMVTQDVCSDGQVEGKAGIKVKKKKSYICDICEKVFNRSDNLKIHMRVHTNEKPYLCVVCNKTFSRSQHLTTHMRSHTGEKPFSCDVCNKRFSESKSLQNHRKTHTGERPDKCDLCGKCFTHSGHLKRHMMTHTTEKPFKCGLCDKMYTRSENLEKHMKVHASCEVYTCDKCDKRFLSTERLDLHLRWHAGEKVAICEICDKLFTKLDYLKKHVKAMHTEQTGFKCQYCSKVCSLKNNLRIHLRTHTGEKPFRCEVCGKTFSQSSQVKSHLLTNHQQLHNPDDSDNGVFMVGSEEESSPTAD